MSKDLEHLIDIEYRPTLPKSYRPAIGLIGCGGITVEHLRAYRKAELPVIALCDVRREAAERRAKEFYPDAKIYEDYEDLLREDRIEVVDIATHPEDRPPIIEAALRAGKHVLSQKPFVLDLDEGRRLVDLADRMGRRLAVNQNGRWAPHWSYARQVVQRGLLGNVFAAHLSCHWDHTWVEGTPFEKIHHLLLFDYGIHWFDILRCFITSEPESVYARVAPTPHQRIHPPLLASVVVTYANAQATLAFDAALPAGGQDRTFLAGTRGSLFSIGDYIHVQHLEVRFREGHWSPKLEGRWFPDGFLGTMGELLCAIEENRPSVIEARDNLESLALCFAAMHSADTGAPVRPGTVRGVAQK